MIAITEKYKFTCSNAWGRDCTTIRQKFVVEASDVGKTKAYYGGFDERGPDYSKKYTFKVKDIGKTIEEISSFNYFCWGFVL